MISDKMFARYGSNENMYSEDISDFALYIYCSAYTEAFVSRTGTGTGIDTTKKRDTTSISTWYV